MNINGILITVVQWQQQQQQRDIGHHYYHIKRWQLAKKMRMIDLILIIIIYSHHFFLWSINECVWQFFFLVVYVYQFMNDVKHTYTHTCTHEYRDNTFMMYENRIVKKKTKIFFPLFTNRWQPWKKNEIFKIFFWSSL